MNSGSTVEELAAGLLEAYRPTESLSLRFGDFPVLVRSNSRELVLSLAQYFREFLGEGEPPAKIVYAVQDELFDASRFGVRFLEKPPDPGKDRIKEEYADLPGGRVVRKRLTGMVFLFGGGLHLALGPCLENDNQVINFINNRLIEHHLNAGCFLFHAAAVARDGRGIAMAGVSGMGKSTLALQVLAAGDSRTCFVSNDRLMVERTAAGLRMHGVAKMPRINPGTVLNNAALASVMPQSDREAFQTMNAKDLWTLEHKYDAFIDECFGVGRFRISAPMTDLVLLNWRPGADPVSLQRVDLLHRPDLMPAFIKDAGLFCDRDLEASRSVRSPQAYLDLLGECPAWEFTGGIDFQAAARLCLDLL